MSISAKIICDSISPQGVRLTTLELCYPRFIHSEVMTHRMFSRNASSSRAIPVQKMIDQVKNSPAMPIHWGKNQSGMQAGEEIKQLEGVGGIKHWWREVANNIANEVHEMNVCLGLHKQVLNRLLEPYQWIKVIVTATEWDNFFNLRLDSGAQPEIRELARCMKEAMNISIPVELNPGEWHLPYIKDKEYTELYPETAIKCSVARCARVSYLNHDNSNPDIEKDIALADRLLKSGHMSPFEHVATPMDLTQQDRLRSLRETKGITHLDKKMQLWSSNFKGWIQYRNVL